jgi:hypothetical protein
LDLDLRAGTRGDGAERRRWSAGDESGGDARRRFAGETRNRDSGLGSGSDLDPEVACGTRNPIEGLRRRGGSRGRRPVVRGGGEPSVRSCGTRKARERERERERSGVPAPLPYCCAPAGAVRRRGAAMRRRGELPSSAMAAAERVLGC